MHTSVQNWITQIVRDYNLKDLSVLEIGSLDVNGSIRGHFTGQYIGVDFREGPRVDRIMNGHNLEFPNQAFDVVAAIETLEHDSAFWLTLVEMGRVLKNRGYLIITTRGNGFAEHGHPQDYWRFMPESINLIAPLAGCTSLVTLPDPEVAGIFVLGQK